MHGEIVNEATEEFPALGFLIYVPFASVAFLLIVVSTGLSLYANYYLKPNSHDSQIPIGIAASGSRD